MLFSGSGNVQHSDLAMTFIGLLIITVASTACVQRMAAERGRSAELWMRSAAFLGPFSIAILALLPAHRDGTCAAS